MLPVPLLSPIQDAASGAEGAKCPAPLQVAALQLDTGGTVMHERPQQAGSGKAAGESIWTTAFGPTREASR